MNRPRHPEHEHLAAIARDWPRVLDPIRVSSGLAIRRAVTSSGSWLTWTGARWEWDHAERHRELVRTIARALPSACPRNAQEGLMSAKGAGFPGVSVPGGYPSTPEGSQGLREAHSA